MDVIATAACGGILVVAALALGVTLGARYMHSSSKLGELLADELAVDLWGKKGWREEDST